ncbi:PepSY-like domain-containing protein [uncultured Brachyspira sp.]|uniref:PepSY-like domain-containing protein n=1 Tax=uncultured Brachyspira sp. TaxID=221953 RepID=UPI0025D28E95|nr:PepSY-like domain-containing protein [uncultured Brachyspira sp.]
MKKILTILAIFSSILIADDWKVDPNELPKSTIDFINKFFPNNRIILAERDRKKYEIVLENGVELEFFINGELKEVEGNYVAVPPEILPKTVANTVAVTFPNTTITKIKKKWNLYEVKLNNSMALYIDVNGQLLGQKFDD